MRTLVFLRLAHVRHDDVKLKTVTLAAFEAARTRAQGLSASSTVRSWSGPQNSAGAGVVTPLSM